MKRERFYLTSPHNWCGTSVMFHAINGNGYTTNIDKAEIITREKAQQKVSDGRLRSYPNQEMPLSSDHVDELSEWRVDCQYVKNMYPEHKDPNNEYVAYRKNCYDGNDLGFASVLSYSFDYSSARIFSEEDISAIDFNGWIVVPKYHTDEIARRTFQEKNINRRKMISCAGVVGLHKSRERFTSGKTRWNCPSCGKIHWQYNPHDFEGCDHAGCDKWAPSWERYSEEF